jgi:hypothetical protein
MPAVRNRYQTTIGEDTADWEDLLPAVVNCRMCESLVALELLVVTSCVYKYSVDPVANPHSINIHTLTRDNMLDERI